jgi:plastocyanin domain-containing protein
MIRTSGMMLILALAALAASGCGAAEDTASNEAPPAATQAAEPEITAEEAVKTTDAGTEVTLYVTSKGFVPANVHVPAGKPVTLKVTRKTERTCATELVMASHGINQPLPLDQTVSITFTPTEPGEIRYACGMDMISGTITVD